MDSVGGNVKVGKHTYKQTGGTYPALEVKKVGNNCYLENKNVIVFHMRSGTRTPLRSIQSTLQYGTLTLIY